MQPHFQSILASHHVHTAFLGFNGSVEGLDDGGLASACPADDAHFAVVADGKGNSFQDEREVFTISGREVSEFDGGFEGPVFAEVVVIVGSVECLLGWELDDSVDPFEVDHVGFTKDDLPGEYLDGLNHSEHEQNGHPELN